MKCAEFVELLSCYVDGELSPAERSLVEKHIRECEACRNAVAELVQIRRALGELLEQDVPTDLHTTIMMAVETSRKEVHAVRGETSRDVLSRGNGGPWRFLLGWVGKLARTRLAPVLAGVLVVLLVVSSSGIIKTMMERRAVPPQGVRGEAGMTEQAESGDDAAKRRLLQGTGSEVAVGETKAFGTGDYAGLAGTTQVSVAERKIIKTARMSLSVERGGVREAVSKASALIEAAGGYVESSSLILGDPETKRSSEAYVVGRVPAENLSRTMQEVAVLGKLLEQNESAQDVTEQYVDLSARLRAKEAQEARLIQIMGQAKTVGELLQVEAELWRVRTDIESMKGQMLYLEKSSALSTLTVRFVEEGTVVATGKPGFWRDVWQAFVGAWKGIFVLGAKILPWVTVVAVLASVPLLVVRRRRSGKQ